MQVHVYDAGRIFAVEDFLTAEECRRFIDRSEKLGYSAAPITTASGFEKRPDIRNNERVIIDDEDLALGLWERASQCVTSPFAGRAAIGLNERWRYYRYVPGQRFAPHVDGAYRRENGDVSLFTLLIYLNDDFSGGATRFTEPFECTVEPAVGTALFFFHHQVHEGCPVVDGTKYVLRTDVMYEARP